MPGSDSKLDPTLPVRGPKSGKAFVVDDEPDIVEILSHYLKEAGFEVVGFTDPVAAVRAFENERPDVVLTDFVMPQMSGLALTQELQEIDPSVPVVLVSGNVDKVMLLQSMESGVYSVIQKPFEEERIIDCCVNAMRKRRLSDLLGRVFKFANQVCATLDSQLSELGKHDERRELVAQLKTLNEELRKLSDGSQHTDRNFRAA